MGWKRVEFVVSAVSLDGCPRAPLPEVAFSGRSNVGKSSLLNALTGRRALAKVSGRPGKTRLLNFFDLDGRGHLVDLPGYGYAAVSRTLQRDWKRFMSEYLEGREQLAGVVQLLDCRHAPSAEDRDMVAWLAARGLPFLLALTKADKVPRGRRRRQRELIAGELQVDAPLQFFSAETGEGRAELRAWTDEAMALWRARMLR